MEESLERELSKWQSNLEEKGLEISIEKSVVKKISENQVKCRKIKYNEHALKVVDKVLGEL
jgi:uncharacterized coiled-coil DUF342 family protein